MFKSNLYVKLFVFEHMESDVNNKFECQHSF